jgi:hypothetical protein
MDVNLIIHPNSFNSELKCKLLLKVQVPRNSYQRASSAVHKYVVDRNVNPKMPELDPKESVVTN